MQTKQFCLTLLIATPMALMDAASSSSTAAPDDACKKSLITACEPTAPDPMSFVHAYPQPGKENKLAFAAGARFFGPTKTKFAAWYVAGPSATSVATINRYLQTEGKLDCASATKHLKERLTVEELQKPENLHIKMALITCLPTRSDPYHPYTLRVHPRLAQHSDSQPLKLRGRFAAIHYPNISYLPLYAPYDHLSGDQKATQLVSVVSTLELIKRNAYDEAAASFFKQTASEQGYNPIGLLMVNLPGLRAYCTTRAKEIAAERRRAETADGCCSVQ